MKTWVRRSLNAGALTAGALMAAGTAAHAADPTLVSSDNLGSIPGMGPGTGFGLGFAVSKAPGEAGMMGSPGEYNWGGAAGTRFWIDPQEELFAVFMSQGPGQREYFRTLIRSLVYAAVE